MYLRKRSEIVSGCFIIRAIDVGVYVFKYTQTPETVIMFTAKLLPVR